MASIFDLDEFKPYASRWIARQQTFSRRRAYYDGSMYDGAVQGLDWLRSRIGAGIKPLYLPCARAVNLDSGIVPGGWLLKRGDQATWDAFAKDSEWSIHGPLYVHFGALYGNSVLRVFGNGTAPRVAPVSPDRVLLVRTGVYDATPRLALAIEMIEQAGKVVEYAEVIEPRRVRTFIEGLPASVDGRAAVYENPFGFVPFVEARHINAGDEIGNCAFQDAMTLLDTVNEVATDLARIIKQHAKPKWAVLGADESDLSNDDDIWTFPAGSDVKVLVPGIDVLGVLKFLQDTRIQVERSIPELAFDEIVSKYNLATATVELQLAELVLLIRRVRPNYDRALEKACRMAGLVGKNEGLLGLEFDADRRILPQDERQKLELELLAAQVAATVAGAGGGGVARKDPAASKGMMMRGERMEAEK